MKIGITCYPTIGGSGAIATELGIWLAGRGHEVHFISYELPFRLKGGYTEGIVFHTVGFQNYNLFKYPPYTMALANKMAEVVKWRELDVIHVHYAIPHAVSAFLAREMLGGSFPYITTLHGTDVTLIGQDPSFKELTRMAIERSNRVTTVSQSLKQQSLSKFDLNIPIDVIPNFVDHKSFHSEISCNHFHPEARSGEKILVHMSNFRHVKRVTDVMKIFNAVQKKIPARLFLIGDGEEMSAVRDLCREYDLCDKVEILGEQEYVACILPRCHLFLMTSEQESFGLAALEAMACGVPVVATRTGGLPEVVEEGKSGYLLPVGDVEGMTEKALEILDEKNYTTFSDHAKKRSRELFDIEKIGPIYEKLYSEVSS